MANKYRAIKVKYDGFTFASKAEFEHYILLRDRQQNGEISNLKCHTRHPIIINGKKVCDVEDDFSYLDHETNQQMNIDCKGFLTPMSRLKAKLVKACYPDINWVLVHV